MSGSPLHRQSNTRWRSHRARMDRPSTRRSVPILDDRRARLVSAAASGSAGPHLRDFNLRYGLCPDQAGERGARGNGVIESRTQEGSVTSSLTRNYTRLCPRFAPVLWALTWAPLVYAEMSVEGRDAASRSKSLTLNPPARDNESGL